MARGVQCRAQRLAEQFQTVERAHGGEDVGAIGTAAPACFQQALFACRVEQPLEQPSARIVLEQAGAELAQHAEVDARIIQLEREQILPVDAATHGVGGLPIAQVLAELHQHDQRETPGRVGWAAASGIEIGEVGVLEHGTETVAQQQVGIAAPERGVRDAGGVFGHGRERLRTERHG